MDLITMGIILIGAFIPLGILASGIRVNKEWVEAIILRFGKYKRTKKAGIFYVIPFIERAIQRDMRITTLDIPRQEVITKDNISAYVDAVVFLKVTDTMKSIVNIKDYFVAVGQYSRTTLRDIIGQELLDDLLAKRDKIAGSIKKIVDIEAEKWGVDIQRVELQNIELPEDMKRVMAVQAEAERESRAVLIKADAEKKASKTLKEAGDQLKKSPIGLQLRILETLSDVSKDQSNTIIFALPTETLTSGKWAGLAAAASINSSAARVRTKATNGGKIMEPVVIVGDEEYVEEEE